MNEEMKKCKVFVDFGDGSTIKRFFIKDCNKVEEVLDQLSRKEYKYIDKEVYGGTIFDVNKDDIESQGYKWEEMDNVNEKFVNIERKVVSKEEVVSYLKEMVLSLINDRD